MYNSDKKLCATQGSINFLILCAGIWKLEWICYERQTVLVGDAIRSYKCSHILVISIKFKFLKINV